MILYGQKLLGIQRYICILQNIGRRNRNIACILRIPPYPDLTEQPPFAELQNCYYSGDGKLDSYLLEKHEKDVHPFGVINVAAPFSVEIKPLDPHDYQDMNKSFITLYGQKSSNISVQIIQKNSEMTVSAVNDNTTQTNIAKTTVCSIELPVKYDINVSLSGSGTLSVQQMEPDNFSAWTEHGAISTQNLKCQKSNINSKSGNVTCQGVTLGIVNINTGGEGKVKGHRFQGPSLNIQTEAGDIDLAAIYSDVSYFSTQSGNLKLNNFHRNGHVHIHKDGNLSVSSLDGSLQAMIKKGDVDVQVIQLAEDSHVQVVEGNVDIAVPIDKIPFQLELIGKLVEIPEQLHRHNEGKKIVLLGNKDDGPNTPTLKVVSELGNIRLKIKDWFSSLNLLKNS